MSRNLTAFILTGFRELFQPATHLLVILARLLLESGILHDKLPVGLCPLPADVSISNTYGKARVPQTPLKATALESRELQLPRSFLHLPSC